MLQSTRKLSWKLLPKYFDCQACNLMTRTEFDNQPRHGQDPNDVAANSKKGSPSNCHRIITEIFVSTSNASNQELKCEVAVRRDKLCSASDGQRYSVTLFHHRNLKSVENLLQERSDKIG